MPNWIYCSPKEALHMGAASGLLGAREMEHDFRNEWEPALLAAAPRRQNRGT